MIGADVVAAEEPKSEKTQADEAKKSDNEEIKDGANIKVEEKDGELFLQAESSSITLAASVITFVAAASIIY